MFGEVAVGLNFFEKQHAQIDLFVRGLMFSHHTFPQFFLHISLNRKRNKNCGIQCHTAIHVFCGAIFFTRSATSRKSSLGMIELGAHSNSRASKKNGSAKQTWVVGVSYRMIRVTPEVV